MALENIPTIGPGALNANLDKVVVYKNGGSEAAVSLLTLTNSALNLSGVYLDPINGRVGIGVPNPVYPLDVANAGRIGGIVLNDGGSDNRITASNPYLFLIAGGAILQMQGGGFSTGQYNTTAKFDIKGKGSTSATTSLLVQNSSGNNALKIQDDFVAVFGSTALKILTIRPESTTGVFGNSCAIGGGAGTGRLDFYSNSNITSLYDNIVILDGTAQNLQVGPAGITATVSTGAFKINSTTQGFLKPKMTTAQKNAIVTPAAGLEVYDTDLNRPCFYSGSAWVTL